MDLTLPILLFAGAVLTLAGFVKGVIGLGLPTIGVGVLGLVMAPIQAAALLVVPNLVTNAWQVAAGARLAPLLRRLWPMLLGLCVGTGLASGFVDGVGSAWATALLGAALVAYGGLGLAAVAVRVPPRAEAWLGPLVGLATGAISIATGVFVVPAVPYLQALGLERDELVQALGLSFLVSTLALAVALAATGLLEGSVAASSGAALLPALAGMALGQRVRGRIAPATFRRWFLVSLMALGVYLVLRAVA